MPGRVNPSSGTSKRRSMPGADELFRPTAPAARRHDPIDPEPEPEPAKPPVGSGRIKHDEKITVYVTADELLALEQARLKVRAELGRNVDRGRFVRAALALALDDLDDNGAGSAIVRRISESR